MARKKPESKIAPTSLPTKGMQFGGGSSGAIDTTSLPAPKLESWGGWASAPQPQREAKP
jgi:hypothetical protein